MYEKPNELLKVNLLKICLELESLKQQLVPVSLQYFPGSHSAQEEAFHMPCVLP